MDLLSDILSQLQLTGTLYFRTSFTSPWSVRVPAFAQVARFHFAYRGRCLVRIDPDQPPVLLDQGDLIIITRGASHTLFCDPTTEGQAVQLDQVVAESGFNGHGTLVYGEPGTHHEAQLICGHFAFDSEMQHPLLDGLPDFIHIANYGQSAGSWMEGTLKIIGSEAGRENLGSDLIALKLSEIIFAQALRTYIESDENIAGNLSGFADPVIAKALRAIHDSPAYPWTLEELASRAGVSRTLLANRFNQQLHITPLGYITQWRMQLARRQLTTTRRPIIDIAETVGYHSEAAFGRVFKKYFAQGPATYRRRQNHLSTDSDAPA